MFRPLWFTLAFLPALACDPVDPVDVDRQALASGDVSESGVLAPGETIDFLFDARAGDRVILWLRRNGSTSWNPRVELYRNGGRIQYGDPSGNADAHIPYQNDRIDQGFELLTTDEYEARLTNQSNLSGEYLFTLECVAGPSCEDFEPPPTEPPTDPWPDLSNGALEAELRSLWSSTHDRLSYNKARLALYSDINNDNGFIEDVYTGLVVRSDGIPPNNLINTEHTWPQSRGSSSGSARSDLNHLFPVESRSNSVRSNLRFCNVVANITWSEGGSLRGDDANGTRCFEPRDDQKGDTARALFYFAVTYNMNIPSSEESVIRGWHAADPPTARDRTRNDRVESHQGSRNPFVDYPGIAERVSNF